MSFVPTHLKSYLRCCIDHKILNVNLASSIKIYTIEFFIILINLLKSAENCIFMDNKTHEENNKIFIFTKFKLSLFPNKIHFYFLPSIFFLIDCYVQSDYKTQNCIYFIFLECLEGPVLQL